MRQDQSAASSILCCEPSALVPTMKLAILTSGGDSAGINAVVRAVVKAGILKQVTDPGSLIIQLTISIRGRETLVVREGYKGLVQGNLEALYLWTTHLLSCQLPTAPKLQP